MQVAQAVPLPLIGAAAAAAAAVGNAVRGTVEDWRKSHRAPPVAPASPSTTNEPAPSDAEGKAAEAIPQNPVAAAPPIPPEDDHDREKQRNDASAEKPQSDGEKSSSASEWDGKRLTAEKIPAEWGEGRPNNEGVGWRWENPDYQGDGVRVDKGNPDSSYPAQREDHVIVRWGGNPLKVRIKSDPINAHIPLKDWLKWKNWNKP